MNSPQIYTKPDLLSADECDFILWVADSQEDWDPMPGSFFDNKTIDFFTTLQHRRYSSPFLQRLSMQVYRKIQEFVSNRFTESLNLDFMAVMRLEAGQSQIPYAYGSPGDGRIAGCVLYLNEGFGGGVSYYPNLNATINARVGLAQVSAADDVHAHGVTEVTDGTRFTIVSTWTRSETPEAISGHLKKMGDYLAECCSGEQPTVVI